MNALFRDFRVRGTIAFLVVGAILATSLVKAEQARSAGAEIVLQTRLIDPRDLFFGHYATLSYSITSMSFVQWADAELRAEGNLPRKERLSLRDAPIYIALKKRGAFHEPVLVTRNKAKADAAGVALRAVGGVYRATTCRKDGNIVPCEIQVRIRPKLPSRYYADRETALALEEKARAARDAARRQQTFDDCEAAAANAIGDPTAEPSDRCRNITAPTSNAVSQYGVILAVSPEGEAVVRGLILDDRRIIDSLFGSRLTMARETD